MSSFDPAFVRLRSDGRPSVVHVALPARRVSTRLIEALLTGDDLPDVAEFCTVIDSWASRGRLSASQVEAMPNLHWQPIRERVPIDLGNEHGEKSLWFGFRYVNGDKRWQRYRIAIDTAPPALCVLEPTTRVVTEPVIQVKGIASDDLATIEFQLEGATTSDVSRTAAITERIFNPEERRITLNVFRCYDVALRPGANNLVLKATDVAGNTVTTNFQFVLNVALDTTPPSIVVDWPQPGMEVNGSTFRVRGRLSEPNANLTVQDDSGILTKGLVERDGRFWTPSLALPSASNRFMLRSTDSAGNSSTTELWVKRSPIEIKFDKIDAATNLANIVVSGTVSDPACVVWVNGRRATMKGSRWRIEGAPVNEESGTAVYQAVAIPLSANAGNGHGDPRRPRLSDMGNPTPNRMTLPTH